MIPYDNKDRVSNFVFDGTSVKDMTGSITVMIGDDDELTALAALVKPGTIAYLAGWSEAWQLDTNGETWVQMIGGGE